MKARRRPRKTWAAASCVQRVDTRWTSDGKGGRHGVRLVAGFPQITRFSMTRYLPIRFTFVLLVAACDLPRDSDGTLDRVRGGTMRVGVVIDTPWTKDS